MADLTNVGTPMVAARGFVALAVEAGIETVIESLVGLAIDKRTLLEQLVAALEDTNPPLAAALNLATLDAILAYISLKSNAAVVDADKLPVLLDENGPVSVAAGWDANPGQVNVTYSAPSAGWTAEIYLNGVFAKHSTAVAAGGFVNDAVLDIPTGNYAVRVLYRDPAGNISRFGPIKNI